MLVHALATAAVLFYFGPFGSRDELLRLAQERAASPLNQTYTAPHQDRLAVVLVTDSDLAALGVRWPMPYTTWAALLRNIACMQPDAVFFDLLFSRQHEFVGDGADTSFATADRRVNAGQLTASDCPGVKLQARVPVFYAYAHRPSDMLPDVVPAARKLPILWQGLGGDYPLTPDRAQPGIHAAAYQLYRQSCTLSTERRGEAGACPNQPGAIELGQRLVPRWTLRPPQQLDADHALHSACQDTPPSGAWRTGTAWLMSIAFGTETASCPPFLTLSATHMLRDFDAETAKALRGRIVLVGASITGAQDQTETATHGLLPGVYLHATALENLLSMGSDFDRIDERQVIWTTALLVVAFAGLRGAGRLWSQKNGTRPWAGWPVGARVVASLTVAAGTALALGALMRSVLHFPPALAQVAAVTMMTGLLLGELSQEGLFHKWTLKLLPR